MKFKIEADVSAKEVRQIFGLPDMEPANQALVKRVKDRIDKGITADDVDGLLRMMISGSATSITELQKGLWNIVKTATTKSGKSDET